MKFSSVQSQIFLVSYINTLFRQNQRAFLHQDKIKFSSKDFWIWSMRWAFLFHLYLLDMDWDYIFQVILVILMKTVCSSYLAQTMGNSSSIHVHPYQEQILKGFVPLGWKTICPMLFCFIFHLNEVLSICCTVISLFITLFLSFLFREELKLLKDQVSFPCLLLWVGSIMFYSTI